MIVCVCNRLTESEVRKAARSGASTPDDGFCPSARKASKALLRKTDDPSKPMQLIADFFPLILFFLAFKLQGIMVATAVAIAASIVQIAWFKWKGKLSPVHWLSFVIILVFGGATLILQDELFIKWKPTVLYALFGLILASGKLVFGRDLIGYLMKDLTLPPEIWSRAAA